MNDLQQKNRVIVPDLLKGIAILFMIQVHLMEQFARPVIEASIAGKISYFLGGTPAAPMFMMIMGYFIAKSNMPRIKLIKRGLKILLWAFLLNLGLNAHILYNIIFQGWDFDKWSFIFGVDILFLAGMSILFIAFLASAIKKRWYLLFLVIVVIFAASQLIDGSTIDKPWNYFTSFFIGGTYWSYFPLLPWLAYPLSGYAFHQLESFFMAWSWHKAFNYVIGFSLPIFLILTWNYASSIMYHLEIYYHHQFGFYIWSVVFSLLWAGMIFIFKDKLSDSLIGKYFKYLGRNITSIFVFQWLIIGNLATIWYKLIDWPGLIASYIIITAISSLLSLAWTTLKQKNWITQ